MQISRKSWPILMLVTGACASQAAAALPSEQSLPHGVNQDCGCVVRGECVVLEEVPGYPEIRNLDCRWIEPNELAHCSFEARFVEIMPGRNSANMMTIPTSWESRTLRARHLGGGRWCSTR